MLDQSNHPPDHLSPETSAWFSGVASQFQLENHHVKLLTLAAEAWDRAQQARLALQEHGLVYYDRFSQPKSRPEATILRDSVTTFARLLRELDLDCEAPADRSRPPALQSNRR
jgi:phage terminase small subunit